MDHFRTVGNSSVQSGKDGDVMSAFTAHDGVACISVSKSNMSFIENANPAVVLALLAELEREREQKHEWRGRAEVAEEKLSFVQQRAEAAESKLATPVRLPEFTVYPLKDVGSPQWAAAQAANKAIAKCGDAVRASGFKVEGDA